MGKINKFIICILIFTVAGNPFVVSWPHFYNGDQMYVNQSVGLSPNKVLHETFLSIEPVSWNISFSKLHLFSY